MCGVGNQSHTNNNRGTLCLHTCEHTICAKYLATHASRRDTSPRHKESVNNRNNGNHVHISWVGITRSCVQHWGPSLVLPSWINAVSYCGHMQSDSQTNATSQSTSPPQWHISSVSVHTVHTHTRVDIDVEKWAGGRCFCGNNMFTSEFTRGINDVLQSNSHAIVI